MKAVSAGGPYVTESQIHVLMALRKDRAGDLMTKDVDIETSQPGLVFVVEKPGAMPYTKLMELREQVRDGRLFFKGLTRTGHNTKQQLRTQFGGCYLVFVPGSVRDRFNFVPFE